MRDRHKILVVDDEPVVAKSAKKILGAEGFWVHTSNDAETALEMLREAAPDIMLIDLKLPKLSGMELLAIVKSERPAIAAIMMTGYSTLDNAVESLKNGAFDFLPKPFAFEELLSTVMRAKQFVSMSLHEKIMHGDVFPPNFWRLGLNSWAQLDADNTARLGVTDLFQQTIGAIAQVNLPPIDDQIQQGDLMARLASDNDLTHTAWAALSGQVIELNRKVEENPNLINKDPLRSGWLIRIVPVNLENELMYLSVGQRA